MIKDIVSEPANSISGITNQLIENGYTIPFEAIFVNWTIANYLDDPDVEQGQYNYESLNLPNFNTVFTHSSYPAGNTSSTHCWAADYIRLYPGETNLELTFTTNHPIDLGVIRIGAEDVTSTVDIIPIDGTWNGVLPEITEDYTQIILVISNRGYSDITYTYSISDNVSADEIHISDNDFFISCYPNPFNPLTTISFSIHHKDAKDAKLEIFNLKGQKIRQYSIFNNQSGYAGLKSSITWDGTDENNKPVSSGIYFYKLEVDGKISKTRKMLLLK